MHSDQRAKPLTWTRRLAETYWRGVFAAGTPPARRQADLAGVALASVLPHVPAGGTLLDLGTRCTELLEVAVAAGLRSSRLDIVTRCVPLPPKLAQNPLFGGEFHQIPERTFDAAIALDLPAQLLEEEYAAFLELVGSILGPKGVFCFIVPNGERLDQHLAIDPTNGLMFHPHQRVRSFEPASVELWLRGSGFEVIGLHQIGIGRLGFDSGSDPLETIARNERSYCGDGSSLLVLARKSKRFRPSYQTATTLLRQMREETEAAPPPPEPHAVTWDKPRIDSFWSYVAGTPLDDLSFARHNGVVLLRSIEPWLKADGRHIDVGAGEGHLIELLMEKGYKVAAFEPATGRQSLLDEKYAEAPNYLGSLNRADSQTPFDVAFAFEVIEHIPTESLPEFFDNVRHFLVNDGVLILTTPCLEDLAASQIYSPASGAVFHRWQHVQRWTPDRLREILGLAGFEPEVIHQVDFYGMGQARHPFYETLLNTRVPRLLGDGSNLLCIARNIGRAPAWPK